MFLDKSLNETGTPATTEEYVKAGFTEDPRHFVVENFSVLLAMDLEVFLKDSNFTFKKRFQEELMMSENNKTFPLYVFMNQTTRMWIDIFQDSSRLPNIYCSILSWEVIIYLTMNNCLTLWQETKAQLGNLSDIAKVMDLIKSNIDSLELELENGNSIEKCLDVASSAKSEDMRHKQILKYKSSHQMKWSNRFTAFNNYLSKEVMNFLCEQRVIQLLKGSWFYTESYGEDLLKNKETRNLINKYYFILLSPNRKEVYYKEFPEKQQVNPSFEEMESQSIKLADIVDFKATRIGEPDGKKDPSVICVKGTISYERIALLGHNNRTLLCFITDTEVNKYVWLDGLKLLKGMISLGDLSEDTESQLESLIDIRRNTQLLNLEDDKVESYIREHAMDLEDDEVYDLDELTAVTDNAFYYK